jgi:rare lipoprotein A
VLRHPITHGFASAAVLAAALILPAATDRPRAETGPEDGTGSFDERFSADAEMPIFSQPEIAALFSVIPPVPDEHVAPAAVDTATAPPELAPAFPEAMVVSRKTPMQFLKELLISPAESGPSPAPPSGETTTTADAAPAPTTPLSETAAAAPTPPPEAPRPPTVAAMDSAPPVIAEARKEQAPKPKAPGGRRIAAGKAAFYEHPGRTANGEIYNPNRLTAAHRSLPFGSRVRVVNQQNKRSVVVRINDRARHGIPFVIDLSRGSARAIGIDRKIGIARVALYTAN